MELLGFDLLLGLLGLGITSLAIGAAVLIVFYQAARRRRAIVDASQTMAAAIIDDKNGTVSGYVRGIPLTFRLTTRGSGSDTENWTELDATLTLAGFVLTIEPQTTRHDRAVAQGVAVDVIVGDPVFDQTFAVEAAPAEVIRRTLTKQLREGLLACQPDEITTVGGQTLQFARRGWVEIPAQQAYLIAVFADLALTLQWVLAQSHRLLGGHPEVQALVAMRKHRGEMLGYGGGGAAILILVVGILAAVVAVGVVAASILLRG
jgi:hypothetical protein